jgi:hypothetical protein
MSPAPRRRIQVGIPGFDEIAHDGLPRGRSTPAAGATGSATTGGARSAAAPRRTRLGAAAGWRSTARLDLVDGQFAFAVLAALPDPRGRRRGAD